MRWDEESLTLDEVGRDGIVAYATVQWRDVSQVLAYKRNLVFLDLMCLVMITSRGTVEIDEQMDGWLDLITALPALIPGTPAPETWFNKVALPPFLANFTSLYPPN
jgi:hypothetical protein